MLLRGLSYFSESERDVFFGREREREELAHLVVAQGFRAGLLYGEAGVGKSSLLRAGLKPDLREQGIVALLCADNSRPLDSFAFALAEATGHSAQQGETAAAFLARVICEGSQIYLFILDDIDLAMHEEPRVTTEVAELFTRVASRSAGRARFLFASSSEHVHRFASLEKRTGSLFPPASRYELSRLQPPEALTVFERIITAGGVSCNEEVMRWLVEHLAESGGVLPVDLQIAAMALGKRPVSTAGELQTLGGYAELERRWLSAVAATTGNERSALRLLGELANGSFGTQHEVEATARRAGVPSAFATEALATLQGQGLVRTSTSIIAETEELQYSLSHEVLGPRVRIITAPATRAAEQVIELLGSKATRSKRLSAREYLKLRREGIVPSTLQEKAVVDRTLLLGKLAVAALFALPMLLLLAVYIAMSGNYYLDTSVGNDGNETIVVRAGKPSLSWFHWLPKSPSFGSIVADTGLSERMVSESFWSDAAQNDLQGTLGTNDYVKQGNKGQHTRLALLIDYAMRGDGAAITTLHASISDPDDFAHLLGQLRPISQATPEEKQLLTTALTDTSAAVQTEALLLAAAGTRDGSNYGDLLAGVLASADSGQRRLAVSVVRTLDQATADSLYQQALARELEPAVRHELEALVSVDSTASTALASAVLLDARASAEARTTARAQITRSFRRDPATATAEAITFLGRASSAMDQVFMLALLLEYAPNESHEALAPLTESAVRSEDLSVRAAAWPLFARVSTQAAAGELATLFAQEDLPATMQIAAAGAWGEIARAGDANSDVAKSSLEQLLRSQRRDVRAAAARAYGYVGRSAQATLVKMVKTEFIDVAESAAHGLANSVRVNAPIGVAVAGIRNMWNRKGRMRRIAAEVFVRMAQSKPGPVYAFLVTASKEESLQALGMRGLCNALGAGHTRVGKDLASAANSSDMEVRRIAIECVADASLAKLPNAAGAAVRVAIAMATDSSDDIRKESALLLAALAEKSQDLARIGPVLSTMAGDSSRDVRMIAVAALATLEDLPEQAITALPDAFRTGEEAEKLLILDVKNAAVATSLVPLAIAARSPLVRAKALDLSIASGTDVNSVLSSSLMDTDGAVRRAALERLAQGKHGLSQTDIDKALALAIRDSDPGISLLAMMTSARLGEVGQVHTQLTKALMSRSETIRARAAAASLGLVARDPAAALALLQPLELDPSHDVRVAVLLPLANAYAGAHGVDGLSKLMGASEDRANRRLATAAAFYMMLDSEETREAAMAALKHLASEGPPLVGDIAALMLSLHEKSADGLAFLPLLVP